MFKAYMAFLLSIRYGITSSMGLGKRRDYTGYGIAALFTGFFWIVLTVTLPLWGIVWGAVWILGAATSPKNKGL